MRTVVTPLLLRTRDVALLLAVSERQVEEWRRRRLLTPVLLPCAGTKRKTVRYNYAEVEELARTWCTDAGIGLPRVAEELNG